MERAEVVLWQCRREAVEFVSGEVKLALESLAFTSVGIGSCLIDVVAESRRESRFERENVRSRASAWFRWWLQSRSSVPPRDLKQPQASSRLGFALQARAQSLVFHPL